MIALSAQTIELAIASLLWPFVRILAVIGTAPLLSHRLVPVRVKIGLALLTAFVIAPTIPVPATSLASPTGIVLLLQQILVGVAIGFTLRIVTAAVELAGELIGLQMGLNFAGFFDPATNDQGTPVGAFLSMMVALLFLAINGHLLVLGGLAESFRIFPIGVDGFAFNDWHRIASLGAELFRIGLYVALPIIATLMICNLGLGILARVAPQLNIFAVGFALTVLVGFFMLALALPAIGQYIETTLVRGVDLQFRR